METKSLDELQRLARESLSGIPGVGALEGSPAWRDPSLLKRELRDLILAERNQITKTTMESVRPILERAER